MGIMPTKNERTGERGGRMLIKIKSLKLRNFKGIKKLDIDFGKKTDIKGQNASRKTTIFDAFTWLLFDKDSVDRNNFSIKTYDGNGEVLHGLDHEVEGTLEIDGSELTLKKTYKEKWTKKRGESERQLTGHETIYYIDEVPVKKKDYTDKIQSIIDENIFKLITNPLYVNVNMNWKDRREILLQIIGDINDEIVISSKQALKPLENILEDKAIEDFKKMVAVREKKLNDELKSIPIRIDEVNNNIPDTDIDFNALKIQVNIIQDDISSIEDKLMDKSKMLEGVSKQQSLLYSKKNELRELEMRLVSENKKPLQELKNKNMELEYKINRLLDTKTRLQTSIRVDEEQAKDYEKKLADLREKWHDESLKTLEFKEDDCSCPTCGQALTNEQIEKKQAEMQEKFNVNKQGNLDAITNGGKRTKEKLDLLKDSLDKNRSKLATTIDEIESLKEQKTATEDKISKFDLTDPLQGSKEYQELLKEIKSIEDSIEKPDTQVIDELKQKKARKVIELDDIKSKLALQDVIKNSKNRIAELMGKEKELANMIAEIEGQEFLCEEFIRTKVDLLESRINNKFEQVRFKLFNTLVNGELEECCETLIDGVPYSDANNAAKINAGIDIINTLSSHYSISAPIFIDNRESVNELLECSSQLVSLIVTKDEELKVEVA